MNITKKHLIVIIPVLLIVIILPFFLFNNHNYQSELESSSQVNTIEKFLSHLDKDLRKDIEENINVKTLYSEITSINNYTYYSILGELFNNANKELKEKDSSLVEYYNDGFSLEEILISTVKDKYYAFKNATFLGSDSNKEYPTENIDKLYYKALLDLAEFNHEDFISDMELVLNDYKFTIEENQKMANVYHDINFLNESPINDNLNLLKSMKDPNAYLIEVMRLYISDRYDFIYDKKSPALYDSTIISINNSEKIIVDNKTKDKLLKEIFENYNFMTGEIVVYKTEFKDMVDLNEFTAYIVQNEYNEFEVYTILSENSGLETIGDYYMSDNEEDDVFSYEPRE